MKYMFIIIIAVVANASYLHNNNCIQNNYYINSDHQLCYQIEGSDTVHCEDTYDISTVYADYKFDENSSSCVHSTPFGISNNIYNALMALMGGMIGMTILIYLVRLL